MRYQVVFDRRVIKTMRCVVVVEAEDRDDAGSVVEEAAENGTLDELKPSQDSDAQDSEEAEVLEVTQAE